ncbi:type II toxin-antitoxin system RelE family toxin [Rickettsia helvetica]|uniref:type II toxin-antitoxin system RelE family toxin n=1 Tax=Rickettsia helvetica TaxID=35789 RepID=UPI000494B0E6|nr:type II toxin-antitoxin system RelE/ParE family toxin [Rickettsia helvetica]MCZ6884587.1 type II toxin-antitoxin system RelE/ParE family toxin [Rickettsia endosymbiont of Ixodes ricinus]MCZ6896746.1 type II toxin-antitoxin system RelE/ParE family toxin [Rickettsia endosymbiont of Ixodes ricinus]
MAKKEWDKLGSTIKEQFKKKLSERLKSPHAPKDAINGGNNLYKIKLRSVGYRLVYEVDDKRIIVLVLAIEKRNRNEVYSKLFSRI